jgi:hypothetical protein
MTPQRRCTGAATSLPHGPANEYVRLLKETQHD